MSLDFLKSIARVEESPEFKGALSESYFCSAITFLQPGKPADYWDLNYYNPKKGDICHIRVSADSVELKGAGKPLKKDVPKKIDIGTIRAGIDESIRTASELQEERHKGTVQKVFASLYSEREGSAVWSISFIMAGMKIFQVTVDAKDGKVVASKTIDFLRQKFSAS